MLGLLFWRKSSSGSKVLTSGLLCTRRKSASRTLRDHRKQRRRQRIVRIGEVRVSLFFRLGRRNIWIGSDTHECSLVLDLQFQLKARTKNQVAFRWRPNTQPIDAHPTFGSTRVHSSARLARARSRLGSIGFPPLVSGLVATCRLDYSKYIDF